MFREFRSEKKNDTARCSSKAFASGVHPRVDASDPRAGFDRGMGVEVLVVESDGMAPGVVAGLRRLHVEAVVVASMNEAYDALECGRRWRGFLVDPKLTPPNDAGVRLLAAIASSKHRFLPRAAISRVASARLVSAAAKAGARYLCFPCDRDSLSYFAREVHAAPIDDLALRAYVNELGVAAGLSAKELETLVAYLSGSHDTVVARLGTKPSTVKAHVRAILTKMSLLDASARIASMHALEAWILRRAPRRS